MGGSIALIVQATPGARPCKTDMRQAMNAIFYLLRTGSPWRYLPRDGFPPRSTVYNIFRKRKTRGESNGGGDGQPDDQGGCKAQKSAPNHADAVGYDAGKKVKERKIHALVDTLGLPIRLVMHSPAVQNRDGATLLLDKVCRRFPWLGCVFADGGYDAQQTYEAAAANHSLRLEVVRRNPQP